jgi:ribosome maturation factor RimP
VESGRGHAPQGSGRPGRPPRPQRGPSHTQLRAELTRLVTPLVAAVGLDLEDVDVRPAGRRRLVRLVVDGDGGVSLDDVATVNQAVSAALDDTDVMGAAPYTLEVTSPGVDRPLTEPRHWRRATGRLVKVPILAGGEIEGRVVSADDTVVELDVAGQRRRLSLDEVGGGKVQVEFRPGAGAAPGASGEAGAPEDDLDEPDELAD